MSKYTYTADDFAQAQFAKKRLYRACRSASGVWYTDSGTCLRDGDMAARDWEPYNPYRPEELERAWEHGEKPKTGEVAEDDVSYIWRNGEGQYTLFSDRSRSPLLPSERVVYRSSATKHAPERDPVADLAQALEDVLPEEAGSSVALRRYAEWLVKYGVRVVTEDG